MERKGLVSQHALIFCVLLLFISPLETVSAIPVTSTAKGLTMTVSISNQNTPPDVTQSHGIRMNVNLFSCRLDSVVLDPQCGADAICQEGELIAVTAAYSGFCPDPYTIQVNVSNAAGTCKIRHAGGHMSGIDVNCAGTSCTQTWPVPAIAGQCLGEVMDAGLSTNDAGMYAGEILPQNLVAVGDATGQFTLAGGAVPCTLVSARIDPDCAGGNDPVKCDAGDRVRVTAQFNDQCPNPSIIQIDASNANGSCQVRHSGAVMQGIDVTLPRSDGLSRGSWTVPNTPPHSLPWECWDAVLAPVSATLFDDDDFTQSNPLASVPPAGGFQFAVPPCNLVNATISGYRYCTGDDGNCCQPGDDIEITANFTGNCPSPSYIQVNVSQANGPNNGQCEIQPIPEPGIIGFIVGMNVSCTGSICRQNWTIPYIPFGCHAFLLAPDQAGIYKDAFIRSMNLLDVAEQLWGRFRFCTWGCGNGLIDPPLEECDFPGNPPFSSFIFDAGPVDECTDLDNFTGGLLQCNLPQESEFSLEYGGCLLNTSLCWKDDPPPFNTCGNGIVDINETCDGNPGDPTWVSYEQNWGNITGCWDFGFTEGNLSCNEPGSMAECHFFTNCAFGMEMVPMKCGNVHHDRNLGSSWPLDTVACNDSFWGQNPFFSCSTPSSCVYLPEPNLTYPFFPWRCFYDGQNWTNYANQTITCQGRVNGTNYNMWCPANFHYEPGSKKCELNAEYNDTGWLCDAGKMYGLQAGGPNYGWPYLNFSANCSLPPGPPGNWTLNYSLSYECLEPDDPDYPLPPDTAWPKRQACCTKFNVSDYNDTAYPFRPYGFFTSRDVKVY